MMSTGAVDLTILCMCGQPASGSNHGPGGHKFTPMRGRDQIRDDQDPERNTRDGHYALREYRTIAIPSPNAGQDWTATIPAVARWRVKCLQAQLVTSAAAFNRVPHLVISDALGNSVFNFPAITNQVASTTVQYSAGVGIVSVQFDNAVVWVLPYETHLLQGWKIGTLTTLLQAGDQWSNIALIVEEWLNW